MASHLPGKTDYALLVSLAAIWGASFLFIKLAIPEIPPVTLTALRVSIGALVLVGVLVFLGKRLPRDLPTWRLAFLVGFFGNALPFGLISWGEEKIDVGLAAMLMAPMPLFTILLAHMFTADEKLNPRKIAGVFCGIAGLVVLIGPARLIELGADTQRELAVILAALFYAINALISKRLSGHEPYSAATAFLLCSVIILVPAALVLEVPVEALSQASVGAFMSVLALGVVGTALAAILMLAILRRQGPSYFAQINFLIPVFGVLWGAIFLAEQPGINGLVALALILAGIAISRGRRPALAANPAEY